MTGFATYPALLPMLQAEWAMSNTEAGLVSGFFFAGYMTAVPVLTALTDRLDARRIYVVASIVAAGGTAGFALLADSAVVGGLFQLLIGVGIAGTYMPGLRALTDNTHGPAQTRAVSFYTAFFGVGVSLSLVLAQGVADAHGWRWAFGVAAFGPLVAAAMVLAGLPPRPARGAVAPAERGAGSIDVASMDATPEPGDGAPNPAGQTRLHGRIPASGAPVLRSGAPTKLLDFRPVLANRDARRYIYGYAVHCWELFGSRSWMVAFLTFAQSIVPAPLSPAAIHAVANLGSPIASIVGNEAALRVGRARVIVAGMMLSGALTCALGFGAALPWLVVAALVVLHMLLVMSDSSTLTAGMVGAADPRLKGATMAVHSTLGFGAGFVSPLVFGAALDLAGGNRSIVAWGVAFGTLGVGALLAPALLGFTRR
jgi:MFS family permease